MAKKRYRYLIWDARAWSDSDRAHLYESCDRKSEAIEAKELYPGDSLVEEVRMQSGIAVPTGRRWRLEELS